MFLEYMVGRRSFEIHKGLHAKVRYLASQKTIATNQRPCLGVLLMVIRVNDRGV